MQFESDLPLKSNGIIRFYCMPCDVAFDRYILAAHVFLEFLIAVINSVVVDLTSVFAVQF
jgi:hypothetical protein